MHTQAAWVGGSCVIHSLGIWGWDLGHPLRYLLALI